MQLQEFAELSRKRFNSHLREVSQAQSEGRLALPTGCVPLYPQMILCASAQDWYVMELIGARRSFKSLVLKKHKPGTLNAYLGQLDLSDGSLPMIVLQDHNTMINICFRQAGTEAELARRFPQMTSLAGSSIIGTGAVGNGNVLDFSHANYARLQNCLAINKRGAAVRIRHFPLLIVIKRSETKESYENYLSEVLQGRTCPGIMTVPMGHGEHLLAGAAFASLYLLDRMRETTLGEFLHRHEDIILTALGADNMIYEPSLEWQEGNLDPEDTAINPDMLIRRPDGFYDICELKLPLLTQLSITRERRRRRRFTDSVMDGLAQLAHYEDYFSYPRNADYASEKYGVRVHNPRKILIIGNDENVNLTHIEEASRMLKEYDIIDYDTLLQLFLAGKGIRLAADSP